MGDSTIPGYLGVCKDARLDRLSAALTAGTTTCFLGLADDFNGGTSGVTATSEQCVRQLPGGKAKSGQ